MQFLVLAHFKGRVIRSGGSHRGCTLESPEELKKFFLGSAPVASDFIGLWCSLTARVFGSSVGES